MENNELVIESLKKEIGKYRDMLRRLEWADEYDGKHYCTICGKLEGGHTDICELAVLLR